jgi:hypothetical protein
MNSNRMPAISRSISSLEWHDLRGKQSLKMKIEKPAPELLERAVLKPSEASTGYSCILKRLPHQ